MKNVGKCIALSLAMVLGAGSVDVVAAGMSRAEQAIGEQLVTACGRGQIKQVCELLYHYSSPGTQAFLPRHGTGLGTMAGSGHCLKCSLFRRSC